MIEIINFSEIKKYKLYIPFDVNNNSILFFDKDIIHKILFYVDDNLYDNLEYLHNCNLDATIDVKYFIKKSNKLVGYSFKNYRDYKSLKKCNNRSIELKINDCYKIIEAFNKLLEKDIIYHDFHCSNILLNEKTNDIKICDLDRIEISKDKNKKNTECLYNIGVLCLMYLYDLRYLDTFFLVKSRYDMNKDNIIPNYYEKLTSGIYEDFSNVISHLDKDLILEKTKEVKQKAKELKYNGYNAKYYL